MENACTKRHHQSLHDYYENMAPLENSGNYQPRSNHQQTLRSPQLERNTAAVPRGGRTVHFAEEGAQAQGSNLIETPGGPRYEGVPPAGNDGAGRGRF